MSKLKGNSIIKDIWMRAENTTVDFVNDIDYVLNQNQTSLPDILNRYAIWRHYTGDNDDGNHFDKAYMMEGLKIFREHNNGTGSGSSSPDNLDSRGGTSYIVFKNADGVININFNGQDNTQLAAFGLDKRIYFSDVETIFSLNGSNDGTITNRSCIGEDYVVLIPVVTDWQNQQSGITYSYSSTLGTGISTSFLTEKENSNLNGDLSVQLSPPITSSHSRGLTNLLQYRERTNWERFPNFQGKPVKHNNWNSVSTEYFLMKDFQASTQNNRQSAKYEFLDYSKIRVLLEGNIISGVGAGSFQDPWYQLSDGSQPGTSYWIDFTSEYEPTGKEGAIEKGVFLDQSGPPQWNPPYYKVKVDQTQDIIMYLGGSLTGRTLRFYFQNWGGTDVQFQYPNALETGVVFQDNIPGVNPVAQANLKGTQLSDNSNAYNTNSQRKYVKTPNGKLYSVYQSMGRVWVEKSNDDGQTWLLLEGGLPLDTGEGKNPSVDYVSDNGVIVAYQEKNGSNFKIKLKFFSFDAVYPYYSEDEAEVASVAQSNSINALPIICSDATDVFTVIWKQQNGYYYCNGYYDNIDELTLTGINTLINGISSSANNLAVTTPKLTSASYPRHIVWEAPGLPGTSHIYYAALNPTVNPLNISTGSGYPINFSPSISVANNYPVVSWVAGLSAPGGGVSQKRIVTSRGTTWGTFQIAGTDANYVNNNSALTTTEKTVIVWSEGFTNPISKWMKRTGTSYNTPRALSHYGIQNQVSSGSDYQYMSAMVFNNNSLPYFFSKSTTDFSLYDDEEEDGGGFSKIIESDTIVTFGRGGMADINGVEFVFNIGDILVGDSIIKFIEMPDTLVYSSFNELNGFTRTENFSLSPATDFFFTNIYYTVQKSNPDSSLTGTDAVNFKAELVNAVTEEVIGTFDNITYNKNNLAKYASIDYQVDCSGIMPGDYYLRLVTTVTGEAGYSLANIVNDNTTLAKKKYNRVSFSGSEVSVTYSLEQNYPNPFNPATTIRYQLPAAGMVTLKVYDILGAEVATLVNEEKTAGRYEVNFNASNLASGIYIYLLNVNDYVSVKKMVLLR